MARLKYLIFLLGGIASANTWADGKIYAIHTNALDCDYCAYDLEQKFLRMKGIKDFEVDTDGVLLVTTDSSTTLSKAFVKKILLDNGFDYKGMTEQSD